MIKQKVLRNKKAPVFAGAFLLKMAEGQGFEPWVGFHLRRFSRPVH
jgi:hypothetical protein